MHARLLWIAAVAHATTAPMCKNTCGQTSDGRDIGFGYYAFPDDSTLYNCNTTVAAAGPFNGDFSPVKDTGEGGLCAAQLITQTSYAGPLFRVYDSSKPNTRLGSWWSLNPPPKSEAEWRAMYAVCYEFDTAADQYIECYIKPNTMYVLGFTQSEACSDNTRYAQTDSMQVYVNAYDNHSMFQNCSEPKQTPWHTSVAVKATSPQERESSNYAQSRAAPVIAVSLTSAALLLLATRS